LHVSGKNVSIVGTFVMQAMYMMLPNSNRCVNATVLPDGNEITRKIANATIDSGFDSQHHAFKVNTSGASVCYMLIRTGERIPVTTCSPMQEFDTVIAVYRDEYGSVEPYLNQHLLLESIDDSACIEAPVSSILMVNDNDEWPGTGGTMTDARMTMVVWGRKQGHKYKICVSSAYGRANGIVDVFDSHSSCEFSDLRNTKGFSVWDRVGETGERIVFQHAMRERIPTP